MANNKPRNLARAGGVFRDLGDRFRLIIRLIMDRRVNFFLKLIPLGSMVYLVFPDILPGPIDDAMVIWLGSYLFVELCPQDVVKEHLNLIQNVVPGEWVEGSKSQDVIDAEFQDEEKLDSSTK